MRRKRAVPVERYVARSLKEIARELGISVMRTWQIEQVALRKIKKELLARRIVTEGGRYEA